MVFDQLIDTNRFKVCAIHYGGITGRGTTSYIFNKMKDSVEVLIIHEWTIPNEKYKINLSKTEFELVENHLRCMTKLHHEDKAISPGCQPPTITEYYLHSKFKTIRIYPINQDTCRFESIIYPKYEKESLINLISK